MTLLALDLSMSCTGYAVMTWDSSTQKATVLEVGHVDNKHKGRQKESHGARLSRIFLELKDVLNRHSIDTVVREKGVTRFNKATQVIFRVVGVVDLLLDTVGQEPASEIGITQAKKAITDNGKADKAEVAEGIKQYLTSVPTFATDDESDAVAIGITYFLMESD